MAKCNKCNRTFVSEQGVAVHQSCTPACGGTLRKRSGSKRSGSKRSSSKRSSSRSQRHGGRRNAKVGTNGETGKEAIRRILSEHPQGLSTMQILDELKKSGFKKVTSTYVSQTAAGDSELRKAGRGVYLLKGNHRSQSTYQTGAAVVQAAVAEAQEVAPTPTLETVLLRNEILENQLRAMQEAHLVLIKGNMV